MIASKISLSRHQPWLRGAVAAAVPRSLALPRAQPRIVTHDCRQFSTTNQGKSTGIFGKVQDYFTNRQERKAQEKFSQQMEKMASSERWTISDFHDDVASTADSWTSKIPGIKDLKEVQTSKQLSKIAVAIMDVLGSKTATADELMEMSRTDKLKVSVKSGVLVEDVNMMLQQFQSVGFMHRVIRQRRLEGKPIPKDQPSMTNLLQSQGPESFPKAQRKKLMEAQKKRLMKGMPRKR